MRTRETVEGLRAFALAALLLGGCENDAVRESRQVSDPPVVALECGDTYDFTAVLRGSAVIYRCPDGQAARRGDEDIIECRCERAKEAP